MFRKLICLLAAAMMTLSLFGCAEDAQPPHFTEASEETVSHEETVHEEEPVPEEEPIPEEEPVPEEEPQPTEAPTRPAEEPAPSPEGHTHSWIRETVPPTCTAQGWSAHSCACGVTEIDGYIEATGHSFGPWTTLTEPTAERTGEAERVCIGCGEKEYRVLEKLPAGHTHSYTVTVTLEPTCGAAGEKTFRCACGDAYTDQIPRTDHSYSTETVSATCTRMGYDVHTCTLCGSTYRDDHTELLPHDDVSVETPATCTTGSYVTFTCKVCGNTEIGHRGPSLGGHKWGKWTVTREATETTAGEMERACTVCGEKETDAVPVKEHTHKYTDTVTQPTCTSGGYTTHTCACGYSYTDRETEPLSHSFVHIRNRPTCTQEGYTLHECCRCKTSYKDAFVPATGHSWGDWATMLEPTETSEGREGRRCGGCGELEIRALDKLPCTHDFSITVEYKAATCKAEGFVTKACSCGETRTETLPMAHDWVHKHTDEVGHYDGLIMCHCGGWSCSVDINYVKAFADHVAAVDKETRYDHSYYEYVYWVVDRPARDWEECSACGAVK